jgi:hypothetical protein
MNVKLFFGALIAMLFFSTSASAYYTIMSMQVTEMACPSCDAGSCGSGGKGLTGISHGTSGMACVSGSSTCSCMSGSSNAIGSAITEGMSYTTGPASVTAGQPYYACLSLYEASRMLNVGQLGNCGGLQLTYYNFNLDGCTCGSYATGYVGITNGQDAMVFAFPFVA